MQNRFTGRFLTAVPAQLRGRTGTPDGPTAELVLGKHGVDRLVRRHVVGQVANNPFWTVTDDRRTLVRSSA